MGLSSDRPEPLVAGRLIVSNHFPDAIGVFLGDTVLGPFATATSDLDLVVITDRDSKAPYRATIIEEGWPVEMFVHTPASWIAYRDRELQARHIAVTAICATGVVLVDCDGEGRRLQEEAQSLLRKGPPPLSVAEWDHLRYSLTDQILDLQGSQWPDETGFIAGGLANALCDLVAGIQGQWPGRGKRAIRVLADIDPVRCAALAGALRHVFEADDIAPLVDVALQALAEVGGPLYDGFRQQGQVD